MFVKTIGFGALAGIAALALTGAAPAGASTVLKSSSCLAKNNDLAQSFLQLYLEPLNKKGAGLVKLDYIGGPEVTPSRRQASAMQRGLVDMIFCPASYYLGTVPEARVLPVSNVPVAELRKNGAYDLLQQAWGQKLNALIVGWCCTDQEFHVYTSVKPKIGKDGNVDFDGMRLRSTELYTPMFKAMNASPVNMPAEDIYTGMQRGLVKGFAWPDGGVVKLGLKDTSKYMLDVGFYRGTSMLTMNLTKFKALPKKAQDLIVEQGIEYEQKSMAFMKKMTVEDWAELEKAGMQRVKLSPAGEKKFIKVAYDAVWNEMKDLKFTVDIAKLKSLILKTD